MNSGKWYLRHCANWPNKRYEEFVLDAHDLIKHIKQHERIDAVCLDTGRVARHDYKKALPRWTEDALIRSMVIATGQLPEKANVDKAA